MASSSVAYAPFSAASYAPVIPVRKPVEIRSLRSARLVCWSENCLISGNPAAVRLYKIAEAVRNFFSSVFGLSGIDGRGKLPTFNIDWRENNAAWDCSEGSNCAWKFNNQYIIPSVVCHEYTHAIIHEFTGLGGTRQAGALHEHLADVMAIIFKRFLKDPSWKVLDRDMSQHFDMKNCKEASVCSQENDACHVHDNSRIPSHAFYAATQFSGNFSKIAHVWFQAMIRMKSTESFQDFANRTVEIASIYKVQAAVKRAWLDVGIATDLSAF